METLGKILGSEDKVKILRLFLFHHEVPYDADEISARADVRRISAVKIAKVFEKIRLLKSKSYYKDVVQKRKVGKRGGDPVVRRKRTRGWILNEKFLYLKELQNLLINTTLLREEEIVKRLQNVGKVALVIVAGVFIQNWDSRVDILVVGENLKEKSLQHIVRKMEAEIGRELAYTALETSDFQYRMTMCDKLVRDIVDYPHKRIFNKLGLTSEK